MTEDPARRIGPTLRRQRAFLLVTAVAGGVWLLGGLPGGARAAWGLMLGLWSVGLAMAVRAAARGQRADLPAALLVQNLAVQLLVGLPAVLVGSWRLAGVATDGSAGALTDAATGPGAGAAAGALAWGANVLTTAIVLPLLSAVVLTCAGLLVATPCVALLRRFATGPVVRAVWLLLALAAAVAAIACSDETTPARAGDGTSVATGNGAGGTDVATAGLPDTDAAAGRELYLRHGCALCHGQEGRGDGPNASLLRPPPRDYTDPAAYRNGTDVDSIAATIAAGMPAPGGGMPAFPHLSERDRRLIAAYVVSLQRPDVSDIEVTDARILEPPGRGPAAAYMTLRNTGTREHVLHAVRARPRADVTLHRTVRQAGMVRMEPLGQLTVPAGGSVRLEPGGLHMMLTGALRPLRAGTEVLLELEFEHGVRRVHAPVVARTAATSTTRGVAGEREPRARRR